MGFHPPDWASQPCREATLEVRHSDGRVDALPIDAQPYYLLGRDATASDIALDGCAGASRLHAALVHHADGRVFLIDLASTNGTTVDGARVAANKPTLMRDGATLRFGEASEAAPSFVVRCESAAEKRRGDGDGDRQADRNKRSAAGPVAAGAAAGGGRPASVRASHLLVKHRDVRRPSSWKEATITRSADEALAMIEAFRRQLVAGDPSPGELARRFAELAAVESHCSSAKRGGDLGPFGPGAMQRAFEDGAFALAVGELSGPVHSDSGVHLILRTA